MSVAGAMCLWMFATVIGDVAPERSLDTLEAVEKQILEKWDQVKSHSATLSVTGYLELDSGANRTTGSGTFESMRMGDRRPYRSELAMTNVGDTFGGGEMRTEVSETVVSNGKILKIFKSMLAMGKRNSFAFKAPLDRPPTMDLAPIVDATMVFKMLKKISKMELGRTSPADLPPVHVVELTFPNPDVVVARMVVYFDKETGIVLRTTTKGRKIEWRWTTDYHDVKVNIELDPNRFVFRLPKGVSFMDTGTP